jgi:ADP-ribosyl-[dinitrogen reductase] hydrolase
VSRLVSARDRVLGCFLGGAIGDALGAPIEFLTLAEIHNEFGRAGLTSYAPAYGMLGAITDDTQMTLFTAEGLIRARARMADRGICNIAWIVHRAYCRWLVTQGGPDVEDPELGPATSGWLITNRELHTRRAPGTTCLSALETHRRGSPGQPLNQSKGCGGLMRIAPVGLADVEAFGLGVELAALTHGHPSGYLAAGAFAEIIRGLMHQASLSEAINQARARLFHTEGAEETLSAIDRAVALSANGQADPEQVESLGAGWVAEEALAISLYCALVATDVRSGLLLAVNHTATVTVLGPSQATSSAPFTVSTASPTASSAGLNAASSSPRSPPTSPTHHRPPTTRNRPIPDLLIDGFGTRVRFGSFRGALRHGFDDDRLPSSLVWTTRGGGSTARRKH